MPKLLLNANNRLDNRLRQILPHPSTEQIKPPCEIQTTTTPRDPLRSLDFYLNQLPRPATQVSKMNADLGSSRSVHENGTFHRSQETSGSWQRDQSIYGHCMETARAAMRDGLRMGYKIHGPVLDFALPPTRNQVQDIKHLPSPDKRPD